MRPIDRSENYHNRYDDGHVETLVEVAYLDREEGLLEKRKKAGDDKAKEVVKKDPPEFVVLPCDRPVLSLLYQQEAYLHRNSTRSKRLPQDRPYPEAL